MKLIVAFCRNHGIGWKNTLPWHLKKDLQHFQKLTTGNGNNAVIMGRKTWESLPDMSRPLPKRTNIVLTNTKNIELCAECGDGPEFIFRSLPRAVAFSKREYDDVWVVGGEQLYLQCLTNHYVETIYATYIDKEFECDAFFPKIPDSFALKTQSDWEYTDTFRYCCQTFQRM